MPTQYKNEGGNCYGGTASSSATDGSMTRKLEDGVWMEYSGTQLEMPFDNVEHPKHYNMGKIETIDYLEGLPDLDFRAANVIKYVSRYKLKNGREDLMKAKWYLERLINEYPG